MARTTGQGALDSDVLVEGKLPTITPVCFGSSACYHVRLREGGGVWRWARKRAHTRRHLTEESISASRLSLQAARRHERLRCNRALAARAREIADWLRIGPERNVVGRPAWRARFGLQDRGRRVSAGNRLWET